MDIPVDIESSRPRRPPRSLLNRVLSCGLDSRRQIICLGVLAFLFTIFAVGRWRRDDVKIWTSYSSHGADSEIQQTPATETRPMWKMKLLDNGPVLGNGERSLSRQSLQDLRNETLGFGNIYVVNLPERMDKLDAIRLTASLTGFKYEVVEAVDGSKVSPRVLSEDWGADRDGQIGCWRSHLSFAHKIIENNLASALVIEDDADWDVALRSQLELFALGSQTLLETPTKSAPVSPYGDGWDLIWLGHCASQPVDDDFRRFLIKNDPTVTPPSHRVNWGDIPDMSQYDNSTRVVYFSQGATCTYAYGLSHHGAQKLLKWLSMDIYNQPIDFGLHEMCSKPERNFKCISVFPQIIADHKSAGNVNRDSDIATDWTGARQKGFSYNIVRSARLNADAVMDGRLDDVVSQWPEDTPVLTGPVTTEFRNDRTENTHDPSDGEP